MRLVVKGNLFNVYRSKDYTNESTGETRAGKWKLQFLAERDMGDGQGAQQVITDISIPDELYPKYKDMIGKDVQVSVGSMAVKGKVFYYGIL